MDFIEITDCGSEFSPSEASQELFAHGMTGLGFAPGELLAGLWTLISRCR